MKDMTIIDFCEKHNACKDGKVWALENCPTGMMSEAYDKLSESTDEDAKIYWDWTWRRAWDDKTLRLLAVRFVRETPLADGRKVFDLLTDERSVNALMIAEKYAHGLCDATELRSAQDAARDAAREARWAQEAGASWEASWAASWAAWAARDAALASALDASWAAWDASEPARNAQKMVILELGNPFREGVGMKAKWFWNPVCWWNYLCAHHLRVTERYVSLDPTTHR